MGPASRKGTGCALRRHAAGAVTDDTSQRPCLLEHRLCEPGPDRLQTADVTDGRTWVGVRLVALVADFDYRQPRSDLRTETQPETACVNPGGIRTNESEVAHG